MSEADIIKILIACQAGLLAMFIWHLFKCRDVRIDIAMIKGAIDGIAKEIGSHETGIRGSLHRHHNSIAKIEGRLETLEDSKDPR